MQARRPGDIKQIALPRQAAVRTEKELCDRVADAEAGAVIIYHIGLLAPDRDIAVTLLAPERRAEIHAIATRAWRLAEAGLADLAQRRIGQECFAYLLIVRRRPQSARDVVVQILPSLALAEAA